MAAASSLSILTLVGLAFAHPGHEDHATDIAPPASINENFAFLDGSTLIDQVVPGGLPAFKKMAQRIPSRGA
ncbi:hypothetical protein TW65_01063 [Stemphylium lycopersici]|nr:hypothetical protein TW65_01063 [Stemphylium lycopersici]